MLFLVFANGSISNCIGLYSLFHKNNKTSGKKKITTTANSTEYSNQTWKYLQKQRPCLTMYKSFRKQYKYNHNKYMYWCNSIPTSKENWFLHLRVHITKKNLMLFYLPFRMKYRYSCTEPALRFIIQLINSGLKKLRKIWRILACNI